MTTDLIHYKKTAGEFNLDAEFNLNQSGITILFGPSGSGKSMLLNCLAGLETPEFGICKINNSIFDDSVNKINQPSTTRRIGYVFQDSRLFPHLNVYNNILYGYKRTVEPSTQISLDDVINRFSLKKLLSAYPHELSGGQKQRVALARAILINPKLLLLDEPMSALDFTAKQELLPYIEGINQELTIPVIYVSHDIQEVLRLGDNVLIMNNGRIIDQGNLADLCVTQPLLTQAEGKSFILKGKSSHIDIEQNISSIQCDTHEILISGPLLPINQTVRLLVHARDVSLSLSHSQDSSILNILPVTIKEIHNPDNGKQLINCLLGKTPILALLSIKSVNKLQLAPGKVVYAQFKATAMVK